jgi:Methyltransferase domain
METIDRIAWALRKARLPVSADALVLDVGAGSCPYPRSDVLLESYKAAHHRGGASVVVDRPIVFADGMNMPFRDKAFDFVVASHILEHMTRPEEFLAELMRVGKAGYIETPNIIFERLAPYPQHVLELVSRRGKLLIRKKTEQGMRDYLARLQFQSEQADWRRLFYGKPQMFHVCHFWKDRIEYEIDNPNESCDWSLAADHGHAELSEENIVATTQGSGWRGWGLRTLRRYYARRQKRSIDWISILVCPTCHGALKEDDAFFVCAVCQLRYHAKPHADFLEPSHYDAT